MSETPELHINNFRLIALTAKQICKDFDLDEDKIKFTGKPEFAFDELYYQVHPYIEDKINRDKKGLYRILYRVDISDGKIATTLAQQKDRPASEVITELVLKRILQKVMTRELYKAQHPDIFYEE
jgi:hypothetical protein